MTAVTTNHVIAAGLTVLAIVALVVLGKESVVVVGPIVAGLLAAFQPGRANAKDGQ